MTDWGVHLLDIVQAGFNEEQPKVHQRIRRKSGTSPGQS